MKSNELTLILVVILDVLETFSASLGHRKDSFSGQPVDVPNIFFQAAVVNHLGFELFYLGGGRPSRFFGSKARATELWS